MAFLFKPETQPYSDETLESYLIRVVNENFFNSYRQLSQAIRDELLASDYEAYGAFPTELEKLNLYHAKDSSLFRVRALELVESLLRLPKYDLLKLGLFRSDKSMLSSKAMLHRAGVDIPFSFFRVDRDEDKSIPICPECIKDKPYIRQIWHLKLYKACAVHKVELMSFCPACEESINYILQESITRCSCGFDFTKHQAIPAVADDFKLAWALYNSDESVQNRLLSETKLDVKIAAIAWYQRRHNIESFDSQQILNYFECWPSIFRAELEQKSEQAELQLIDTFNNTSFRDVFGDLIVHSFNLSRSRSERHFIAETVLEYLVALVSNNPKTSKANIADLLLNIAETAALLSTSYEQVYRLYESGVLKVAFRQKLNHKLASREPAFYLRQVIELKKSYGHSFQGMYVSKW